MTTSNPTTSAASPWGARTVLLAFSLILAAVLALTLRAGTAHAANFNVVNTNDSGPGSLRTAILRANANANPSDQDAINFNIPAATDPGCDPASGVCTISPESELPDITEPVIVDGYSQTGATANTLATGNDAQLKIELSGANAGDEADGFIIAAANSVLRGLIINRWDSDGVEVDGPDASSNKIEGNYIGTDASGTQDLGNEDDGVEMDDAPNNVVGGTSARARNIISGNDYGANANGSDASGNKIQGNYIGTDKNGTAPLGNANIGVLIIGSPNNTLGGTSAAASNTIAFSGDDGVAVLSSDAVGNSILRNSIHSNGELSIDLNGGVEDPSGVTPNDPQDPDLGPNLLQNFPAITSATTPDGSSAEVQGTLKSNPNEAFTLQFFSSPEADPSGYGEGETYLGQTNVTVNAGGNAAFTFSAGASVAAGDVVTATATNVSTGDTSEFSEAVEVADETGPRVVSTRPEDGARGVPARANVFATFSEAMRTSSINANTFKLFLREGGSQTLVPAQVSYDAALKRASLNPNADLEPGGSYVATVTTGARDLAGNPLVERKNFRFTVAR